jgi:hypothetical protein
MSLDEQPQGDGLDAIEAELDEEIGYRAPSDEGYGQPEGEPEPGYHRDPDDDPAQRHSVAARDASALTRAALITSVVAILLSGVLALLGVPGMQTFSRGFAIGAIVATLNLRILANASWWVFNGRLLMSLFGFGASFASLLGVAAWIIQTHPQWTLGYGVGLGLPAVAGIVYAFTEAKSEKDMRGL